MRNYSVSVCMATYNGINYIEKQIQSILPQLNENDELLISDDHSSDGTWQYLERIKKESKTIRIYHGPCKGVNYNFFYLFELASKDIIFISDQDDVWDLKKIDKVCQCFDFHPEAEVVLHRDIIHEEQTNTDTFSLMPEHGFIRNLLKSTYSGHRMAFKSSFRRYMKECKCDSYDIYLGLLAELYKKSVFLDEFLDVHIIHGGNLSKNLSIYRKIMLRVNMIHCVLNSLCKKDRELLNNG